MKQTFHFFVATLAACSLPLLASCDDDGEDDNTTTSSSTSGTGGQGGTTSSSSTSGTAGGGGSGGEGGGGLGCPSCTDLMDNGSMFTVSCGYDATYAQCNPNSSCALHEALSACACGPGICGDNGAPCYNTYCHGNETTAACHTCMADNCTEPYNACVADVDGIEG